MGVRDPLDADDVQARLTARSGWTGDRTGIAKTFAVSHEATAKIFAEVWQAADELEHHPDIDIRWNTVTLVLSTHSVGGLTAKDFELAARISRILQPQ